MSTDRPLHLALLLALGALLLAGCTNPDTRSLAQGSSSTASPESPGEPPGPPPRPAAAQAPRELQPSPQAALASFAGLYVNWSYRTLSAQQRELAAICVGAARLQERQAAASSAADSAIAEGHIHNSGRVLSIAPQMGRRGLWVIVTRERTAGGTQYAGLAPSDHVTLARLEAIPGGYVVSEWLPQS